MSVRQYDEEPFPYQVEHYADLERGQWVEVRQNDVKLPVGSKGVILKRVAETGNYQVAVEVEGEAKKRVVALCQDQVRPVEPPLPQEPAAAAEPEPAATGDRMSAEGRERQRQATKAYWERKKAERSAAATGTAEPKAKPKPKRRLAPADIDAQLAATSAKLAEQAAAILKMPATRAEEIAPSLMTRHRPEGMDAAIAEAVLGAPAPAPEIVPEMAEAIRQLQDYREPYAPSRSGTYLYDAAIANPPQRLVELTWTRRAADAIRPVLAEAAAAGGDVTQLALLVETISYLEDGGRP